MLNLPKLKIAYVCFREREREDMKHRYMKSVISLKIYKFPFFQEKIFPRYLAAYFYCSYSKLVQYINY